MNCNHSFGIDQGNGSVVCKGCGELLCGPIMSEIEESLKNDPEITTLEYAWYSKGAHEFIKRTEAKWQEKYAKLKMAKEGYEQEIDELQLERKQTEHKYSHVCKTCYGVGEIGHQLQDGSYENHTCPDCVGYIQEQVWKEAADLLDRLGHGHALYDLATEGKRRGYIKC